LLPVLIPLAGSSIFVLSRTTLTLAVAGLLGASAQLSAQHRPAPSAIAARAALMQFAQKDVPGFASVREPWQFRFPADHAAHPAHRTETWRFSGTAAAAGGERFGFQMVFLRVGVIPASAPVGPSSFAARDVYWAQLSITEATTQRKYVFERQERADARAVSGASIQPARVWVEDWRMEVRDADSTTANFWLRASQDTIGLELHLHAAKAAVTQESAEAQSTVATGFHAYMLSRLIANGRIHIGNRVFNVQGLAWLDRAWGQVPLPVGAVVWDRFFVHLADGRELMAMRLRRRDGSAPPMVSAAVIEPDGKARLLDAREITIDSAADLWRLLVPNEGLELELVPYTSKSGPARVNGESGGEAHGFVELAPDLDTETRQ
jgi:predicted secreted hydrolase